FEGKAFGLAWPDLRDVCTAPWSCHRMQIDGVNMMRIGGIFQVERYSVTDPHTDKGTRNGVVERPIAISASRRQKPHYLGRFHVHRDVLRFTVSHWLADLGGILGNVQPFHFGGLW